MKHRTLFGVIFALFGVALLAVQVGGQPSEPVNVSVIFGAAFLLSGAYLVSNGGDR